MAVRLTLASSRFASQLRTTPRRFPTRFFSQPAPQPAPGSRQQQAAAAWSEPFSRTPSAHRQSSRWRPPPPWHTARNPTTVQNATRTSETTSSATATTRAASSDSRPRLLISYHDLERALERRGLKNVRAILVASGALAVAVGLAWPRIKQWGAVEGAEVAAASLEHEQLQAKATAMVHEVLTDPRTAAEVEKLLKGAVLNMFADEEFTGWAIQWTTQVLSEALLRDALVRYGTEYVANVLSHEESVASVKDTLSDAVSRVVADESVQDTVASGFWSGLRASMLGRRRPRHSPPTVVESVSNPSLTHAAEAAATSTTAATAATASEATPTVAEHASVGAPREAGTTVNAASQDQRGHGDLVQVDDSVPLSHE